MNLKLFFSHSWADKAGAKVKKLLLLLQKDYEVWLDKKQIDLGNHINDTVANGIEQCDIFITVWSQNANDSKGVLFELETAARLKKPILILLIENFDTAHSPYLAGKEYIDFSGDAASFNQQEVYLQNYLLRKKMELFQHHFKSTDNKAVVEDLAQKTENLQDVLIELEDTIKRQKINASGNDDSDVYINSSLNAFEKTLDPAAEEGKIMLLFSARMKEISAKYPLKEDDNTKKRLAIIAIDELDPLGQNKNLSNLKLAFEKDLAEIKNETAVIENKADDKFLVKFSMALKEIAEKYPLKTDDKVKKRMALKAIEKIDPSGQNENLSSLKYLYQQDLELNTLESTKHLSLPQQNELELLQAYKTNVEKTKNTVLQKSKSALDAIPIFSFLSSINTASTEFEMSYITNSPAVLEKMYESAILSQNKELRTLIAVLIQHIIITDLVKAEATGQIKSFMPYAYLINNTARLLVQAKALNEQEVSYSLVSSLGLDKLAKFFFKEDWKEKAEQFLDMVKNNYGIEDKNLNWLKVAATIVGVALVADGLAGLGDGDSGDSGGSVTDTGNAASKPVYFEDKMAAMGLSMPNTVQY